jgi:hypothetical protein
LCSPDPRVVVAGATGGEVKLTAERVEHDNADARPSAPSEGVQADGAGRGQHDEPREAVRCPRVAAFPAMGTEAVGDDETTSFDRYPNAEAVGDAHSGVRSVVGERLGDSEMQIALIAGWY